MEQAQLLLLRLEVAAEAVGLHVNYKKTEYMIYNQPDGDRRIEAKYSRQIQKLWCLHSV